MVGERDLARQQRYDTWKVDPTPQAASDLLSAYDPLIQSEMGRFGEGIAAPALKAKAKKLALNAFRSYNPDKGAALSTHLVHQLRRLHRAGYESAQALRLSEELQSGVNQYRQVRGNMELDLGREPTTEELQDTLGWSQSRVKRLERQLRGETAAGSLEFDPVAIEHDETDARISYVYHDLAPRDKLIFEWTTGYGGKEKLSKVKIAERLGVSPVVITQRSAAIAKSLMAGAGLG